MADEAERLPMTIQVTSLLSGVRVSSVLGCPKYC